MDLIAAFYSARQWLGDDAVFDPTLRSITGILRTDSAMLPTLKQLDGTGHVKKARVNGQIANVALLVLPPGGFLEIDITLSPMLLDCYEGMDDLLAQTVVKGEPSRYFVYPLGEIVSNQSPVPDEIRFYRQMLRVKNVLRSIADLDSERSVVFLAPQPLAMPFICQAADLRELPKLDELEAVLSKNVVERDQRTALLKRSLREYLFNTKEDERFSMFLAQFAVINDSYRRDFLLWIGQAFGELEKSFEEKRLKFIADLNGILASVQTSILAVPLAVLLVGDKYDLANPLKNFLLALTVLAVAIVADRLLSNQRHTLTSVNEAIAAVEEDFENKQPQRKKEFESRLTSLRKQQNRVSRLLNGLQFLIWVIVGLVVVGWLISFCHSEPTLTWLKKSVKTSATTPALGPTPQH